MININSLSARSQLKLVLNIADCVLVQYNYTAESLKLIKLGNDLLYKPETVYSLQVHTAEPIFHPNTNVNNACTLLHTTLYNYNQSKNNNSFHFTNVTNSFRDLLGSVFSDHELVNTFLMIINTKRILIKGEKGYMITDIVGHVRTKYHYPKDFLNDTKYSHYYVEIGNIIIKSIRGFKHTLESDTEYNNIDFEMYIKLLNDATRDYQDYLYNKRKDVLSWNGEQEIFII